MPDTKWKKNVLGKPWLLGETLITGIGQGYILATPMQICKSMAQFANGGYEVNPTFYLDEKSKLTRMDFESENIKIINDSLVAATNEPGGTAYGSRLTGKLKFAGKTGTSQVTKLNIKDREDNANPNVREYKYRDHSLFAGYGPVEEPKYAVAVVAEHSGPGSRGRVLRRASGTEALVRVMVEADELDLAQKIADSLAQLVRLELK